MQKITFTNWVNDRLSSGSKLSLLGSPKVHELTLDLQDGTILIRLLELLTSSKIRGYERSPKITAQKMVNLDLAFEHIKSQGIRLTGIGECMHTDIPDMVAFCIVLEMVVQYTGAVLVQVSSFE